MSDTRSVAAHYTHGGLLDAITTGLEKLGKTSDTVLIEDLGSIDEFHIGGRAATEDLLDRVGLGADDHVLDVGCGLGGASRLAAQAYGSRVMGIDLTHEYIEVGKVLCSWVGLEERVTLEQGDATATGYPDGMFDKAFMLHVGMNISDEPALALELHRVLGPGGKLGIYDVMCLGNGAMAYPVPWATSAEGSAIGSPAEYKAALEAARFRVTVERNRRGFALESFARLQANASSAGGPPPPRRRTRNRAAGKCPAVRQDVVDVRTRHPLAPPPLASAARFAPGFDIIRPPLRSSTPRWALAHRSNSG